MWKVLSFIFILNCLTGNAAAGQMDAPELMQLRLQGYQLVTQLLQSHNPNVERNRLTKSLPFEAGAYQEWKSALSGLNDTRIDPELEILSRVMKKLDGLTNDQVPMLPTLLNPLLQAQFRIDEYLQEEISRFDRGQNEIGLINRQLIDIARFGLYYQTRIFSGLMVFSGEADGELLVGLDADIRHQFSQLSSVRLVESAQLERSQTHYEFVSHSILESRSGWIPDGAMYYLNKSINALLTAAGYNSSQVQS